MYYYTFFFFTKHPNLWRKVIRNYVGALIQFSTNLGNSMIQAGCHQILKHRTVMLLIILHAKHGERDNDCSPREGVRSSMPNTPFLIFGHPNPVVHSFFLNNFTMFFSFSFNDIMIQRLTRFFIFLVLKSLYKLDIYIYIYFFNRSSKPFFVAIFFSPDKPWVHMWHLSLP